MISSRMSRRATQFVLAFALLALLLAGPTVPSRADAAIEGPVPATILRVIDGDTILVKARIWLGLEVTTLVRLDGVDTPELRGRCPAERALAERARAFVVAWVGPLIAGNERTLVLRAIRPDKYGERVLARVATQDGADLGAALVAAGLARDYSGAAREGWCFD